MPVPSRSNRRSAAKSAGRSKRRWNKTMLIYNPRSGQGLFPPFFQQILGIHKNSASTKRTAKQDLQAIEAELTKLNISVQSKISSSAAEATALARQCVREQYDLVIAVGGDGTINAVVNGLAGSKTALAVIPGGTINIFGLQMRIPTDVAQACRRIKQANTLTMDLGKANDRYFACMAGIGFDAFIIKATDPNLKRSFGVVAYALSALLGFFIYPFRHIQVRIDKQPYLHKGYFLMVGNARYYGGDLLLWPKAKINDGFLDVCIFKQRGFFHFLAYLWGLRRGRLEKYMDVEYLRCRHISLKQKQHIHLDGEYYDRARVHIQVEPKALRVVV